MNEGAPNIGPQGPSAPVPPVEAQVESVFTAADERAMDDIDLRHARQVQAEFDALQSHFNVPASDAPGVLPGKDALLQQHVEEDLAGGVMPEAIAETAGNRRAEQAQWREALGAAGSDHADWTAMNTNDPGRAGNGVATGALVAGKAEALRNLERQQADARSGTIAIDADLQRAVEDAFRPNNENRGDTA